MARDPFSDDENSLGAAARRATPSALPLSPQVTGRAAYEDSAEPDTPEAEPFPEMPEAPAPAAAPAMPQVMAMPEPEAAPQEPEARGNRPDVAAAMAERQALVEQPYEPVYHRASSDPREEARILAQGQAMEEQSLRERSARRAQIDRGLAAQGVEFEVEADGSKRPALHPDGALRYKPGVVSPLEWDEGGRAVRRERNEFGNVYPVDLLKSGQLGRDYKRDKATGEFYADTKTGPVWLGGRDEGYLRERDLRRVQELSRAEQGVMTARTRTRLPPD